MVFILLSPAKTMVFDHPRPHLAREIPYFQDRAVELAALLKKKTPGTLGKLMGISDKLAQLNAMRFKDFSAKPKTDRIDPAILAYRGDTYQGLDAKTLTDAQLKTAQKQIGILTGLYGIVQPLDAIQPYRLEMSTAFTVGKDKDLYAYWDGDITDRINQLVKKYKHKAVIGGASNEYLSAVQTDRLIVPFIQCDFKEKKNGKLQTIGLFAKRARGMMARYSVEHRVLDPRALRDFTAGGYAFDKKLSDEHYFVFVR